MNGIIHVKSDNGYYTRDAFEIARRQIKEEIERQKQNVTSEYAGGRLAGLQYALKVIGGEQHD